MVIVMREKMAECDGRIGAWLHVLAQKALPQRGGPLTRVAPENVANGNSVAGRACQQQVQKRPKGFHFGPLWWELEAAYPG